MVRQTGESTSGGMPSCGMATSLSLPLGTLTDSCERLEGLASSPANSGRRADVLLVTDASAVEAAGGLTMEAAMGVGSRGWAPRMESWTDIQGDRGFSGTVEAGTSTE